MSSIDQRTAVKALTTACGEWLSSDKSARKLDLDDDLLSTVMGTTTEMLIQACENLLDAFDEAVTLVGRDAD